MKENRHYRCSQPKNAVPFACGSCRKFKPEVLVEWKAALVFMRTRGRFLVRGKYRFSNFGGAVEMIPEVQKVISLVSVVLKG